MIIILTTCGVWTYTANDSLAPILLTNVTHSGLQDQLLGIAVAQERPDLEELKNQLIVNNAQMKATLQEIEDKILYKLSTSKGSPVDDLDLIHTLEASKLTSSEIKVKPDRKQILHMRLRNSLVSFEEVMDHNISSK